MDLGASAVTSVPRKRWIGSQHRSRDMELSFSHASFTKGCAMNRKSAETRRMAPLSTRSNLDADAVRDISGAVNALVADMFALYIKTKNFHWHVSGPHFHDYHLLMDEQARQI